MLEVADAFASKLDDRFQNQVQGLGHTMPSNYVVGMYNPSTVILGIVNWIDIT